MGKIGNYGPPHVWSDKEANAFSGDGRKVALQINSREEGGYEVDCSANCTLHTLHFI